jgi:hypothetical protein
VLNEKLVNTFEEMQSVQKFHSKLNSFFHTLRSKVVNESHIFSPETTSMNDYESESPGVTRDHFNPNNINVILDHETISMVDT